MTEVPNRSDFDSSPPMPVNEYEQTVTRVNMGYNLFFTLTESFLRALKKPELELLVVGAGGGAEIERFCPGNPGWHLTGVDPSADMIDLARKKVDALGAGNRVNLIRGTVEELRPDSRFDAATCLFVLHFLTDAAKLSLLKGIAGRLRPGGALVVVTGVRPPDDESFKDIFLGAWQQYGEMMGMPAGQMAAIIERLVQTMTQPGTTTRETYVSLLREAGFYRVAPFMDVMGALAGWIAL